MFCARSRASACYRAWSFTHPWPISTAWMNITVCSWDLCLTLVNRREKLRHGVFISYKAFSFKYQEWKYCSWVTASKKVLKNAEQGMGLFMWDFAHGKYIWMWPDIHFSQHYSVAMRGERERQLECYRSLDKDCSHCQVSRPGQLNTEADPSTCAHPWDRALERQDGNRRGVKEFFSRFPLFGGCGFAEKDLR